MSTLLICLIPVAFVSGIVFDRWMMGHKTKPEIEAKQRFNNPPILSDQGDDEMAKARMREGNQL